MHARVHTSMRIMSAAANLGDALNAAVVTALLQGVLLPQPLEQQLNRRRVSRGRSRVERPALAALDVGRVQRHRRRVQQQLDARRLTGRRHRAQRTRINESARA